MSSEQTTDLVRPCVACGEAHDDGPTGSNGDVWCGECYREGTVPS